MEINNIILNSKGRLKNVIVLTIRFRTAALGSATTKRLQAVLLEPLSYHTGWCRFQSGKFSLFLLNEQCQGLLTSRKQHRRHETTSC
jgi:hypothetical protein